MAGWSKKIIANLIDPEETRIAITDERGKLCDFFIERMLEHQRTGEIYKARVDSVLPGMNSAFLNLGDGRNGFLYLDDVKGKEVRPGMDMLVQVVKNARKGKGARVSPRISLAGRYMVLIPGGHETGVSKRIASDEERARLRSVAKEIRPKGFGIIIRTVAENCDIESLRGDVENLVAQWGEIEHRMKQNSAPCLIHKDIGLLERVLRDELTDEVDEIVIDSEDERENIEAVVKKFFHENVPEVNVCTARTPLFELYGLENQIEELQDRKVWLNSGAYLVIDQTEALTVIDVNTGKFIGSKNLNDTVLKTNLEAAVEIARQLRLRALGGIVVVDFIDIERERQQGAHTAASGAFQKRPLQGARLRRDGARPRRDNAQARAHRRPRGADARLPLLRRPRRGAEGGGRRDAHQALHTQDNGVVEVRGPARRVLSRSRGVHPRHVPSLVGRGV